MTDTVLSALVWGGIQVTVIALVGIFVSLLFVRRSPIATSSAICAGLVTCGVLTLLAPIPLHQFFSSALPVGVNQPPQTSPLEAATTPSNETLDMPQEASAQLAQLGLSEILTGLRTVTSAMQQSKVRHPIAIRNVTVLFALLVVIGLVRLAFEWRHVVRLKRQVTRIESHHVATRLTELGARVGLKSIPQIGESRELSDAAACGWFHPLIILPRDWQQWNDDELNAVLAHELAHISRRDTPWRIAGATIAAMHFYNPTLHWLFRRLILAQEMSADQLAAMAIGPKQYLRSLSTLAIRRDDQIGTTTAPRIIPVFSGQLITRIKWLHSKEGIFDMTNTRPRQNGFLLFGLANLALGLALLATRGLAQPPAETTPQGVQNGIGIRLTTQNEFSGNAPGLLIGASSTDEAVFQNEPLPLEVIGEDSQFGMIVLHVDRVLKHPQLRLVTQLLNPTLSTELAKVFKTDGPLPIRCEEIEWIAVRTAVHIRSKTKDQVGMVTFPAGGVTVKTRQPFDLAKWMNVLVPEAKRAVIDNTEFFELTEYFFGQAACCVWAEDETTIRSCLIGQKLDSITRLSDVKLNPPAKPKQSAEAANNEIRSNGENSATIETHRDEHHVHWSRVWNQIDRGLFSVVFSNYDTDEMKKELQNPEITDEFMEQSIESFEAILNRYPTVGVTVDIPQNESKIAIRFHLIHSSHDEAAKTQRDLMTLCPIYKASLEREAEKEGNAEPAPGVADTELQLKLFNNASCSVEDFEDGAAQAVITTHLPLNSISKMFSTPTTANSEQPERR